MSGAHETEHKAFGRPDELREFPHGRAEIVTVGGAEIGRLVFEPGWRWSSFVDWYGASSYARPGA